MIHSHPFYLKFFNKENIIMLPTMDIRKYLLFEDRKEISIGDVFYDRNYQVFYVFTFIKHAVDYEGIKGFGFLKIEPDSHYKEYLMGNYHFFHEVILHCVDLLYLGNVFLDKDINLKTAFYEKKHYRGFNYLDLTYKWSIFKRYNNIFIIFKDKSIPYQNLFLDDFNIEQLYKKYKQKESLDFNLNISLFNKEMLYDKFYQNRKHLIKGAYNKPVINVISGSIYHLIEEPKHYRKLLQVLEVERNSKRESLLKESSLLIFYISDDGDVKIKTPNTMDFKNIIINSSSFNYYYEYKENEEDDGYLSFLLQFL